MSKVRLAKKTNSEFWQSLWHEYQREHPGAFSASALVDWAVNEGKADLPKVNPKIILVREVKRASREVKIRDPQDREVREMLPAQVPHFDASGQMYIEVVYDHIHKMSLDHALLAFDQRDENIRKQKRSASRDLQSFLDNNPNAKGNEQKFLFEFLEDTPAAPQPVHKIPEKPIGKKNPR